MANLTSINYTGALQEKKGTTPTIAESGTALTSPVVGSDIAYTTGGAYRTASVYTTSNKTVIAYYPTGDPFAGAGGSSYQKPTTRVATVTGDTITYGNQIYADTSSDAERGISIGYEQTENKVLLCYGTNNNHQLSMVVGTISGTWPYALSWGTPASHESGSTALADSCRHHGMVWVGGIGGDTTNRLAMVFKDLNREFGSRVFTISGTTPTGHAKSLITTSDPYDFAACYIGGGKFVVTYLEANNLKSRVGTVTGGSTNTIAYGSVSSNYGTVGSPSLPDYMDKLDIANNGTDNKFVCAYMDGTGSAQRGKLIVGTVSGTTISYGTAVEFDGAQGTDAISLVYHAATQKFLICYKPGGSNNTTLKSFDAPNTAIENLSSATILSTADGSHFDHSCGNYDPVNKKALFFRTRTSQSTCYSGGADLLQSSMTLDLSTGSYFTSDLQGNGTSHLTGLTITESLASGTTQNFVLRTIQGSIARRFIWSLISNVKWSGTAPNLSSADNTTDVLSFTTFDEGIT